MPTIEGKQAGIWINDYVKDAGKLEGVAKAVRVLVKDAVKGVEEYVNPWKIPSFDSNGPLCCFMVGKQHVTFAFMRGARCLTRRSCWRERGRACGMSNCGVLPM